MKSFRERFNRLLTEEEDVDLDIDNSSERPRYDDAADREAFDKGVDPDIEASEYDVEGLGEEVYSAVDDTTQQVIKWAEDIESFTKRMIDPENPDALLSKLASVSNVPEFATAAEGIAKHLKKAVSEIAGAKTELDVLASLSGTRRDARKAGDAAVSGGSGPY